MKRILAVVVSVFLLTAAEVSVAAATTITIPAGDGAVISGVIVRGCDASRYGYSALSARLVVYFSPHPSASAAAVSDSAWSSEVSWRRRRLFSNQAW